MNPIAIMETSVGRIEIELWPERAPKHVANFETLVEKKFYDNLVFHRVIPGFMIQTGCPNGNGMGGPGWKVDAEFNKTPFTRGVVGMARSAHPNSAGSQFFICVADASHLNGSYTAFGKVLSGLEACDSMAKLERDRRDRPLVDVKLVSITMPGAADNKKKVMAALEAAAALAAKAAATAALSAAAEASAAAASRSAAAAAASSAALASKVATPVKAAAITKPVVAVVQAKPVATRAKKAAPVKAVKVVKVEKSKPAAKPAKKAKKAKVAVKAVKSKSVTKPAKKAKVAVKAKPAAKKKAGKKAK
ncbi:MAG: peptidylprolyl isomerase [Planctomycetes bacterium]|nr:peptidylprolyl isomerase [Planctomycetota bacterium]